MIPQANKSYITAAVREEAEKLILGKAGSASKKARKSAAKASYNATLALDMNMRPDSPKNWYTATARKANSNMLSIARTETRKAYKSMKKSGALSGLLKPGLAVGTIAIAAAAPFAGGKTAGFLPRREFMTGAAVVLGLGLIATPSAVMAENTALLAQFDQGTRTYAAQVAPSILSKVAGS